MTSKFSIAVIIPMFNEEIGAALCIEAVMKVIKDSSEGIRLIIVNDGSSDDTLKIMRKKQKRYPHAVFVVNSRQNRGYGGAIKLGIKEAKRKHMEYVIFMDSDLTNNPKDITKLIERLRNTKADCIKASRYIQGGGTSGVPLLRRFFSYMGNLVASRLFDVGINDCTNGFRLVRRSLLDNLRFKENSFAIIMEEMYELKKKGARFAQVPVILASRSITSSHFNYTFRTFFDYGKYVIQAALL